MFDRLDINLKYQVLMEEMSVVGIPPSSLQGGINSVFRNKYLILRAFYVELTLTEGLNEAGFNDVLVVEKRSVRTVGT